MFFYCSINLYILVYQNILDTNHVIPIISEISYLAPVVCSIFMFHDRAFQLPCKAGEITRYINAFVSKHLPRIPDAFNDGWTTVHRWLPRYGITHKLYYDNNHRMRHIVFLLTMIFFRVKFDIRFFYRIGILEYFCGIMKSSIFRRPEIEFYVSWP